MRLFGYRAIDWAMAAWENQPDMCSSFQGGTLSPRCEGFSIILSGARKLPSASSCSTVYAVEFQTLVADVGWNDEALQRIFQNGLSNQVKDELAARDEFHALDSLIFLVTQLDNHFQEHHKESLGQTLQSTTAHPLPDPTGPSPPLSFTAPQLLA